MIQNFSNRIRLPERQLSYNTTLHNDKKYILFTDYTRRILDSSFTELEDMTNTQSNRFYARTTLLVILYFVAPAVIFWKIKKWDSLSLCPFWLFICFPLL